MQQTSEVTIQSILDFFERSVREKLPISPSLWVESAAKLNVLISDEHNKLFELQQKVNQQKVDLIEKGESAAKATMKVEATDDYKRLCIQRAFIERLEEHIRLAKKMATLASNEMNNY